MNRFIAIFFAACLLFSASSASAQPAERGTNGHLESQVLRLLNSPDKDTEAVALHLIIYHESRNIHVESQCDFNRAAPQLVQIVEQAVDVKRRILAETALHLSNEKTWQALASRVALYQAPRSIN